MRLGRNIYEHLEKLNYLPIPQFLTGPWWAPVTPRATEPVLHLPNHALGSWCQELCGIKCWWLDHSTRIYITVDVSNIFVCDLCLHSLANTKGELFSPRAEFSIFCVFISSTDLQEKSYKMEFSVFLIWLIFSWTNSYSEMLKCSSPFFLI